ncbi:MAG TPA: response regulator [Desulfatiglandales bacterium]|nr:response regulator [Desulfatiglandales bacterium]
MPKKKALVVDNDFFFMEFLAELLEARDYEVIRAYDGKEGISKLEQGNVDLILVDMIMPKIDGKQLIRFTRSKYPDAHFPIVALSIIEQIDGLSGIDADYFIAKAPAEKMAVHIDMVLDKIEKKLIPASSDEVMIQPDDMVPRHITSELMQSVNFQQAITESMGIGIIVVDRDARIITTNSLALDIIDKSYGEVLNREAISVFPYEERAKVMGSLRRVLLKTELRKMSIFVIINSLKIRMIVSLLRLDDEILGWVIGLCMEPGTSINGEVENGTNMG